MVKSHTNPKFCFILGGAVLKELEALGLIERKSLDK